MIVINSQKYIVVNEATKSTGQFENIDSTARKEAYFGEKMHDDSLRFSGLSAL